MYKFKMSWVLVRTIKLVLCMAENATGNQLTSFLFFGINFTVRQKARYGHQDTREEEEEEEEEFVPT